MKSQMNRVLVEKWVHDPPVSPLKSMLLNSVKMLLILLVTVLVTEGMLSLQLGDQNLIMVFLLSVLVISFVTPTYVYGIMAALLSTVLFDLLYNDPRMSFSFTIGFPVTLLIMLLVTFAASTMTMQIKHQARVAMDRREHAQMLFEINQQLLAARDLETIVHLARQHLTANIGLPVHLYVRDPAKPEPARSPSPDDAEDAAFFSPEQCRLVHRIFRLGVSETQRPVDDSSYQVYNVPVASRGKVLGVVGIHCGGRPVPPHNLRFVHIFVGQLALALELQFLSDKQSGIIVEAEKEKMRGTLLRSISHDLRTPLTSILGASSTLLEQPGLEPSTRESLIKDIKLDAQWLIRMVENILIITRISGDNLKVHKQPEAAEEVVSGAVAIVRKRFPDYIIHVHIPDELLIVPMDATLISQVLINLLENAVKNSPDGSLILVDLRRCGAWAEFDVSDNGSGIPEHLLENLFEVHSPTKEQAVDVSRGMGIGLSICKTIVQAHGGVIEGRNRTKNGAKFTFRLPLEEGGADV